MPVRRDPETPQRPSLQMRLQNFRLFKDTGWFRLAPLTCLVGRNSSGKSSIITALLLLKQSIEQEALSSTVTPLSLNGPYCDLGNYRDVIHHHDESLDLSVSFRVDMVDLFPSSRMVERPFVDIKIPRAPFANRYYGFGRFESMKLPSRGTMEVTLTFSSDEPFGPSLSRVEIEVETVGGARFVRTTSGAKRQHWRVYTTDLPRQSIALRTGFRTFFPAIDIRSASYTRSAPKVKRKIRIFAEACDALFRYLTRALMRNEAIGPFRTPPERRYAFGGFSSSRTGPSGERAVDLLITESLLAGSGPKPLQDALSFWIRHLKLAKTLDVRDIARRLNLFEVDVSGAGKGTRANIVDVGFGISQVLPVIVQGLLTRPGGLYVVQQPEIHLHPDAQAGLADFFIYLASYGVITVVETHSEYLLLRLRRRLAEGGVPEKTGLPVESREVTPLTRRDVAVLLTCSDRRGASVTQLEIGESFQFENLPPGFMSQSLEDRVHLLGMIGKNDA